MDILKIKLDYYDKKEKEKFKKNSNKTIFDRIESLTGQTIEISKSEFLTYFLFKEKNDIDGFRTFHELSLKVPFRQAYIDDYLEFSSGTIKAKHKNHKTDDVTERLGIALSLCVANKIHDLTEADWKKIKEERTKTLDYEHASTGSSYIYVESKGSIIENTEKRSLSTAISSHKSSIVDKKDVRRPPALVKKRDIYYGIIGAIDHIDENILKLKIL